MRVGQRLPEALYVGLDRRVYRRLAELSHIYDTGTGPATIPLTQDHLAGLVGGKRPSVDQIVQKLATQNLVSLGRGRIEVCDRVTLKRRSGLGRNESHTLSALRHSPPPKAHTLEHMRELKTDKSCGTQLGTPEEWVRAANAADGSGSLEPRQRRRYPGLMHVAGDSGAAPPRGRRVRRPSDLP